MPPYLVIHYSEIGLKGRNRAFFERQLQHNIRERLSRAGSNRPSSDCRVACW